MAMLSKPTYADSAHQTLKIAIPPDDEEKSLTKAYDLSAQFAAKGEGLLHVLPVQSITVQLAREEPEEERAREYKLRAYAESVESGKG